MRRPLSINIGIVSLLTLLVFDSSSSMAKEVYQARDEKGHPVFTDQPSPDATPVDLAPVNVTPGVTPRPPPPGQPEEVGFSGLRITVPSDGEIIPMGRGNFAVNCTFNGELDSNHSIRLILNGNPYATAKACQFDLMAIPRGTHQLRVELIDSNQTTIFQSPSINITVQRPG